MERLRTRPSAMLASVLLLRAHSFPVAFRVKMTKRERSTLQPADMCAVLKPMVMSRGRSFVRYSEEEHIKDVKIDKDKILSAVDVLQALKEAAGVLNFRKSDVTEAITMLAKECKSTLASKCEEHEVSWIEVMSKRIRNVCSSVAEVEKRRPLPKWCHQLPWLKPAATPADAAVDSTPTQQGASEFLF